MRALILPMLVCLGLVSGFGLADATEAVAASTGLIELPQPQGSGPVSVEQALGWRRSNRTFQRRPLSLDQVSRLVWAAQGVTAARFRTAPSAGALYPLELLVVVGDVTGLEPGVYRYDPASHGLRGVLEGDVRKPLSKAALSQKWVRGGAIVLVFSAVYERTTAKYGQRGTRYVHMEAGHAAQNVYLQSAALGLGTVVVGAFRDSRVKKLLQMQDHEQPLSLMPVGHPPGQ